MCLVAAVAWKYNAIGKGDALPWRLPGELKYFRKLTMSSPEGTINAVVMGRKTWESIPEKYRPLPGRLNIVLSRQDEGLLRKQFGISPDVIVGTSLDHALELISNSKQRVESVFIIGGSSLFEEGLSRCDSLYLTRVYGEFPDCDTFFPDMGRNVFGNIGTPELAPSGIQKDGDVDYEFFKYKRLRPSSPDPTKGSPEHSPVKQQRAR